MPLKTFKNETERIPEQNERRKAQKTEKVKSYREYFFSGFF